MKIGIDMRPMVAAGVGRGLVTYTTHLIKSLLLIDQENSYCLFVAKNQPFEHILPQLPADRRVKIVSLQRPTKNIVFWDQVLWPHVLRQERIDIFHSLLYGVPLRCPCRRVLTIHDLTPFVFPKLVRRFRHKVVFRFNFFTGKYADRIITSSQNSKHDLMHYLHIPEKNISVVFDGVAKYYRIIHNPRLVEQIKERYHIPGKYLLYVGGFDRNKNLLSLVKTFRLLLQENSLKDEIFLVFVGALSQDAGSLCEFVKTYRIEQRVIFTGFVPEEDLIGLYNGAEIFVFPSLYEGFGLPPLEAMACGTPVITSNAASLPEVVGDAGIQVALHSPEELGHAIIEVLTNNGLREDLRKKGIERANLFSWEETARHTLRVYHEVFSFRR
jgi:glycosyltransferase involved in cell wall biosynthesis